MHPLFLLGFAPEPTDMFTSKSNIHSYEVDLGPPKSLSYLLITTTISSSTVSSDESE